MSDTTETLKRMGDLLVERGFATRHLLTDRRGAITWNAAGLGLKRDLRRLFGVPAHSPGELPPDDLIALLTLLLHHEGNQLG